MLPTTRVLRSFQRRLPLSSLSSLRRPSPFAASPFSTARTALATPAPSTVDQFASGNNAYYAEEMYKLWKEVSILFALGGREDSRAEVAPPSQRPSGFTWDYAAAQELTACVRCIGPFIGSLFMGRLLLRPGQGHSLSRRFPTSSWTRLSHHGRARRSCASRPSCRSRYWSRRGPHEST